MKKSGILAILLFTLNSWAQDVCNDNAPFVQIDKTTVNIARGEIISLAYCDRINKTNGYQITRDGDTVYVDVIADTLADHKKSIRAMHIPIDLRNVNIDKKNINIVVRAYTSYTTTGQTPMMFTPIPITVNELEKSITAISDPSGSWYDPAYNGAGFVVIQVSGGTLLQFYGYTRTGERLWLLSNLINESWILGQSKTISLYHSAINNAATFSHPPALPPGLIEWGKVKIAFDSCNKGSALLSGIDGEKNFSLQKIVGLTNVLCTSGAKQ